MNAKIGFIGLGRMGRGMARNLLKAKLSLMVYARSPRPLDEFDGLCPIASSLEQLFDYCDVLMLVLPASDQVEEVVDKFIAAGVKDKIVIDHTTSYPPSTIELAERMRTAGGTMLDAPMGGGPPQAESGEITLMVGGDKQAFDKLQPIFQAVAKSIFHVGPSGQGHTIKLAGNYLSIMYTALYAEILPFAQKMGADPDKVFEVISACGANSAIFQVMAPRILHDRYEVGFQMELAIKDLTYVKRLFTEQNAQSPLLETGLELFHAARREGYSQGDTSEVARINKRLLGLSK
ncbi:MAG: NAD(P)-dependent oxidoreductase [Pirellulales bacterium]|nr:NAD(P)-dependent oxidoreductase [Pirellulales bacterium]